MIRSNKHEKGYTLLELFIVLAIIAIILSIVIPNISRAHKIKKSIPATGTVEKIEQIGGNYRIYLKIGSFPNEIRGYVEDAFPPKKKEGDIVQIIKMGGQEKTGETYKFKSCDCY